MGHVPQVKGQTANDPDTVLGESCACASGHKYVINKNVFVYIEIRPHSMVYKVGSVTNLNCS